jgi:hypothetical protein
MKHERQRCERNDEHLRLELNEPRPKNESKRSEIEMRTQQLTRQFKLETHRSTRSYWRTRTKKGRKGSSSRRPLLHSIGNTWATIRKARRPRRSPRSPTSRSGEIRRETHSKRTSLQSHAGSIEERRNTTGSNEG